MDAARRAVREVDYQETDSGRKVVAALVGEDEVALWSSEEGAGETLETLRTPAGEKITRIALGGVERLVAGTDQGNVYHWSLAGGSRLTSISPVGGGPITALSFALGEVTFLAGTEKGQVSGWFEGRLEEEDWN